MPTGMLSPIMEVRSENISPLVTPRDQLLSIPESSRSPSSHLPPVPAEKQSEKKPKTVAFADLPLLLRLRLRSPTMRFKVPNYGSKWKRQMTPDRIQSTQTTKYRS